jgi:hypothetical protein
MADGAPKASAFFRNARLWPICLRCGKWVEEVRSRSGADEYTVLCHGETWTGTKAELKETAAP